MAWEVLKREDTFQGSGKSFISIHQDHIAFNAMFTRMAGLNAGKYVVIHGDAEDLKLGFEFCDKEESNSLKLSKSEGRPGLFCAARGIIRRYAWLMAVANLENHQEKRFEPTKEGKRWAIQLCPAFETRKARESADIPSDLRGIYRYLRESGETVYIGRGCIKDRLMRPEIKDWDFDAIEYSKVDNPDQQVKWEHYWIERHKAQHNSERPFYNKVSGSDQEKY